MLTYRQILPIYPRGYVHPAEIQAMFRVIGQDRGRPADPAHPARRGQAQQLSSPTRSRDAEAGAAPVGLIPGSGRQRRQFRQLRRMAPRRPKYPGALDAH